MSRTTSFAPGLFPATKRASRSPFTFPLSTRLADTVLNAFTTFAPSAMRWSCSAPLSRVGSMASPQRDVSASVTSTRASPSKAPPISRPAFWRSPKGTARTSTSPHGAIDATFCGSFPQACTS